MPKKITVPNLLFNILSLFLLLLVACQPEEVEPTPTRLAEKASSTVVTEIVPTKTIVLPVATKTATVLPPTKTPTETSTETIVLPSATKIATVLPPTETPNEVAPVLGRHGSSVLSFAFSADGQMVTTIDSAGISVWQISSSLAEKTQKHFISSKEMIDSAFSPNGQWLVVQSATSVKGWDLNDETLSSSTPSHLFVEYGQQVYEFVMSPDGKWLVSHGCEELVAEWACKTHGTRIVQMSDGSVVEEVLETNQRLGELTFSNDGHWLALGQIDGSVRLWDMTDIDAGMGMLYTGDSKWFPAMAFSPNNQWLATEGSNNTILLWDLSDLTTPILEITHTDRIDTLLFSPDGQWFLSQGRETWVWQTTDFTTPMLKLHLRGTQITFSPDGQWLASIYGDVIQFHAFNKLLTSDLAYAIDSTVMPSPVMIFEDLDTLSYVIIDHRKEAYTIYIGIPKDLPAEEIESILARVNNLENVEIVTWDVFTRDVADYVFPYIPYLEVRRELVMYGLPGFLEILQMSEGFELGLPWVGRGLAITYSDYKQIGNYYEEYLAELATLQ